MFVVCGRAARLVLRVYIFHTVDSGRSPVRIDHRKIDLQREGEGNVANKAHTQTSNTQKHDQAATQKEHTAASDRAAQRHTLASAVTYIHHKSSVPSMCDSLDMTLPQAGHARDHHAHSAYTPSRRSSDDCITNMYTAHSTQHTYNMSVMMRVFEVRRVSDPVVCSRACCLAVMLLLLLLLLLL